MKHIKPFNENMKDFYSELKDKKIISDLNSRFELKRK